MKVKTCRGEINTNEVTDNAYAYALRIGLIVLTETNIMRRDPTRLLWDTTLDARVKKAKAKQRRMR